MCGPFFCCYAGLSKPFASLCLISFAGHFSLLFFVSFQTRNVRGVNLVLKGIREELSETRVFLVGTNWKCLKFLIGITICSKRHARSSLSAATIVRCRASCMFFVYRYLLTTG